MFSEILHSFARNTSGWTVKKVDVKYDVYCTSGKNILNMKKLPKGLKNIVLNPDQIKDESVVTVSVTCSGKIYCA